MQLDRDWVLRFSAILELLRRVVLITAVLLGAGVIAVVGNTIRLEILNRRAEIEVTKLVGGSNAFVRRPFLYAGVLYGILAGAVAWSVVALARASLAPAALRLASAYGSGFTLAGSEPCANWACCCCPAWRLVGSAPGSPPPASWPGSSRARLEPLAPSAVQSCSRPTVPPPLSH